MTTPTATAETAPIGRLRELRDSFTRTSRTLALGRALRLQDFRSGHWFERLATLYVQHHEQHRLVCDPSVPDERYEEQAQSLISRSAWQTGLIGSSTAALSTGAILFTSETGGYGGVLALPVAAVGIGGDMVARALIQLQMTCLLGDLHGVPFESGDMSDLSRLYALAFGVEDHLVHQEDDDRGRRLIERIAELRGHEIGVAIGSKLLSESLLRNVIPFVGVALSGLGSMRLTRRVGDLVHNYVHYRAVVDPLIEDFDTDSLDVLIEGIWFVLAPQEPISHGGAALLAHLVNLRAPEVRDELTSRFLEDPSLWLDRLGAFRGESRTRMLRALEAVAAVETPVPENRVAMLRRAADALHQDLHQEMH